VVSRRIGLLLIGALAVAGLTATAGWSAQSTPETPVATVTEDAATQTVTLTTTLDVATGAVLRDTDFVWAGPSDAPMLRLSGAGFASLENIGFDVPDGRHATAAVELANGGGGPFGNSLANLRIGNAGHAANLDYGIHWVSGVNGDSNTLTNIAIFGVAKAGVAISNPQATGNTFRGLYVFQSPIGLQTAAGGAVVCANCGFIGSSDVDVELVGGAGLIITGVYSEGSRSFARIVAGAGAGGLSVSGGYWQKGPAAVGATFTGQNMCCYRSWLRLTDFMVTPLDPGPHGSVSGIPADKLFFSNVAGVAT
jgi:hypothetical protein